MKECYKLLLIHNFAATDCWMTVLKQDSNGSLQDFQNTLKVKRERSGIQISKKQ